jgi:hypothetical protein
LGVTNSGFNELCGLAGNVGTKTAFANVATGTGSTAFAASQTALVAENTLYGSVRTVADTVAQATTTVTNDTLRFTKVWTISGGTVTVRELGVFNATPTGGTMLARSVLTANKSIATGETYTLTYNIKFA